MALVPTIAAYDPSVFTITEKAPIMAISWLKADTTAFTFKTQLRHYAKRVFSVITNLRMDLFEALMQILKT